MIKTLDDLIAQKEAKTEAEIEADLGRALEQSIADDPLSSADKLNLLATLAWAHPPTRHQINALKGRNVGLSLKWMRKNVGGHHIVGYSKNLSIVRNEIELSDGSNLLGQFDALAHELCHANQPSLAALIPQPPNANKAILSRFKEAQAFLTGHKAQAWAFAKAKEILTHKLPLAYEKQACDDLANITLTYLTYLKKLGREDDILRYFDDRKNKHNPFLLLQESDKLIFQMLFCEPTMNPYDEKQARIFALSGFERFAALVGGAKTYDLTPSIDAEKLVAYCRLPGHAPFLSADDIRANQTLFYGPWNHLRTRSETGKWLNRQKAAQAKREHDFCKMEKEMAAIADRNEAMRIWLQKLPFPQLPALKA